jgi:hypothetical protein
MSAGEHAVPDNMGSNLPRASVLLGTPERAITRLQKVAVGRKSDLRLFRTGC